MLENRLDLLSTQEQFTVGAIPGILTNNGIDQNYSTLPFHGGNDNSINIGNNYISPLQSNSSEITDYWAIASADVIDTSTATEGEDWLTGIRLKNNSDGQNSFPLDFNRGKFVAGAPGKIKINSLVDGGGYRNGQLAIASLAGLEEENIEDRADFNKELARRALTNSELGYVVMSDAEEGALFNKGLGEFNHNRGEYLGTKTFSATPGDEYAFIFVPNGKIEDVFNNPNIGGSRTPLYSLGTDSPDDGFPLGQFVDVTGDGEVFAFEDIKIDRKNADLDYNDLIFSVSGVTGEATPINQAINPQKDWRKLPNGQEFLELVEALKNDTAGPEISIELAKDNGADNTDGITSDPTVTGTVTDDLKIVSLLVGFEETSAEEYVEIIDLVDGEGNFKLDESKLTEIFGDNLVDSPYTLKIVAEDAANNQSTREITFTLDTSLPKFPLFFDSGEFVAGNSGKIQIDYLFDGGGWRNGQLAITSLAGLEEENIDSYADFNKELARRALTNSELGYVVMSDREEGALFNKRLGEKNRNSGEYLGVKTFSVTPGDKYAFIFVPNGKIEDVFKNPKRGGSKSPLYSLGTDSPDDEFPVGQFVDVTGEGQIFAFEDIKIDRKRSDRDYNDLIFSVSGATGEATPINEAINPQKDWRNLANGQEFLELVESLIKDNNPPEISVELAKDTGADNSDGITNEATITGRVTDDEEIVSLRVGFNDTLTEEYAEIIDLVDAEGNFNLDQTKLTEILGKNLADGPYTLNLIAEDAANNQSATEIAFTLDVEAPELSLLVPIAGGDHSSTARLIGTATDGTSGLSTVEYSLDGQAFSTVEIDPEGKFDSALGGLSQGPHQLELQLTNLPGNQTQQPLDFSVTDDFIIAADGSSGWGAFSTDTIILGEKDSLLSQVTVPLELGQAQGKRTLKFSLDAQFDTSDSKAIEDIFQVFIKDAAGENLINGGQEGTAAFSLAGEAAEFVPGTVRFNGSTVEIDLSSVPEQSNAVLTFKLINSDTDTDSIVKVESITNTLDPEGFVGPSFPVKSETVSPADPLEIDNLSQNPDLELIVGNVRLNETSGEYIATVRVQNNGKAVIGQNIAVVFNELPQGIELQNPSGSDTAGNPYINLRNAILRGGLDFGQTSDPVEVIFSNPDLAEFPLAATVLAGGENIAPEFEPVSDLTVTPGDRLEIPLVATDANGDRIEYAIESDKPLPQGQLTGDGTLIFSPTPEEIGSYQLTLTASDGSAETTQTVTLTVSGDTTTTTRLTGTIENTSEEPLKGVIVELGDLITTTNADGTFVIEAEGELPSDTLKVRGETISGDITYPFIAEKLPLVLERSPYTGYNNVIWRPIYLPPIDTANAETVNPAAETLVTTSAIPGASVLVPANGLRDQDGNPYTGELSITAVPNDLTPAALPTNLIPDLVVTIQPGEMVFTTPAPLSLPNIAGYEPGTQMDLWSINPNTGLFDNVGVGRVSSDGSVVETISGGIRNSSWHFFTPPAPEPKDPEENPYNPDETCNECKETEGFTSVVELHSGAVVETHDLVPYQSLGVSRGLRLTYDSLRADARPILHFGYENVQANPDRRLVGNLTVSRGGFLYQLPGVEEGEYGLRGGDRLWSIPSVGGEIDAALQVDMRSLPSGQYDYELDSGLRLFNGERFTGSSTTNSGKFLHVNSIESHIGSGWGLAGLQELIENPDGSVLLVDGDGSELLFEADEDGNFVPPPGDFSVLERLPDGTFLRTLKDKTVYEFDGQNRLATMSETNGDETEYVYDGEGRLEKVVDPAGLETSFVYLDGRLSSIVDPAGRTTELEYDSDGNLAEIIDPDESRRQFAYDSNHRLVEEIDKRGEVERAEYDFAGRANAALRKDGSRLQVAPVQVRGLYPTEDLLQPFSAPSAFALGEAVATSADANGNVAAKTLDRSGQVVSAVDSGGLLPGVERDEENLVQNRTNARGNLTNYSYDEMGNVVRIEDELSPLPAGQFIDISETGELVVGEGNSVLLDLPSTFTLSGVDYNQILVPANGSVLLDSRLYDSFPVLKTLFEAFAIQIQGDEGSSAQIFVETRGEVGSREFIIQWHSMETQKYLNEPGSMTFEMILNEGTDEIDFNVIDVDFEDGEGGAATIELIKNLLGDEFVEFYSQTTFVRDGMSFKVTPQKIVEGIDTLGPGPRWFTYDPVFNLLEGETDELGRQTLYERDPITGNLLSVTRVVGDVGGSDDAVTTYTYTDRNLVDTETDALGRITDYDYDPVTGQLSKVTFAVGTDDEAVQEFEYDLAGNQTAFIDENGNRTEYKYDLMGRLVETIYAVGTADEAVEKVEYDEAGLQTATVDANGNRTEYEYDEMGRLVEVVGADPDGEGPEVSPMTTYEFDEAGNQVAMVDPLGRRTTYVYDGRDRLVETVYPDGSTERMGYDVDNNPTSTTDAEGNESDRLFDARGRMVSQTDPLGNTTTLEYDGANQLIAQVDANNKRTEFEYDELGRRITVTDAVDTAVASTTKTEYDLVGNVEAVIDPLNQRTEYEYDDRSRQIQVKDAENGIVTTKYDSAGNVIELADPEGNVTTFVYDGRQRLKEETNQLDKTRSYEYDGLGNLIAATDRNNRRREFVIDGLNRQTEENWVDEVGNIIHQIAYNYDAAGQLNQVTDPDSTFSYTYDPLGRMLSVDNAGTPGMPNVVLSYDYNSDGNLVSLSETIDGVEAGVTAYSYDESDRIDSITQTGDGVSDKRVDFDRDNIGQFSSIRRYADLDGSQLVAESTYNYDELNRIDSLTHSNGSSNLAFYEFEFDAAGRIRQITDIDGTTDYSYDSTNQLTTADRSDPNNPDESYDYDANGNRINSHLHDGDYVTGANNRLESDGVYNYEYDDEGNLIRRVEIATGAVRTLEWDYRNRLVEIVDKDAASEDVLEVEFAYDPMDRRFRKVVDSTPLDDVEGETTYFASDRDDVLLEFVDADGPGDASEPVLVHRYLHGPQVDQILAKEDGDGETVWHLTDHLGTVRDLVDNDGEVLNHLVYDSFGNVVSQTDETVGGRYRFTGREFDEETGLHYYRARYYDADVGRFISEDPIGFESGDVNLYRYVGNSPLDRVDPSGLASIQLTALLNAAKAPTDKNYKVYNGLVFSSYDEAFASAMGWFSVITIKSSHQIQYTPSNPKVPWNVTANLIDDTGSLPRSYAGKGILRPSGWSGPIPTIDLKKDKFRKTHNTPGHEKADEIKFRYAGDQDQNQPIALVCPYPTPAPTPAPTPTPTPAPAPAPAPTPANPWRMPQIIPPLPIPRRLPFPFSTPRH